MNPLLLATGAALALLTAPSVSAQNAASAQAGMWEYRMEMKMPGMQVAIPPQTFKRCLTEQDVAQNKHLTGEQGKNPCTISNFKNSGSKVSFEFACKSEQGTMKGSSSGNATATSIDFETRLQMIPPPQPGMSEMLQKIQAKRIGNC